jgi:LysR family glycine cleavage system transcriptional activator
MTACIKVPFNPSDRHHPIDTPSSLFAGNADVAIRYARTMPPDFAAQEIFRNIFFPVCSPELLAKGTRQIERAADLLQYPLIHGEWMSRDREAPTWAQWLATARSVDPGIPDTNKAWDLSFREELHAIDAIVAGQILSRGNQRELVNVQS